jgi:hypothetical protein
MLALLVMYVLALLSGVFTIVAAIARPEEQTDTQHDLDVQTDKHPQQRRCK